MNSLPVLGSLFLSNSLASRPFPFPRISNVLILQTMDDNPRLASECFHKLPKDVLPHEYFKLVPPRIVANACLSQLRAKSGKPLVLIFSSLQNRNFCIDLPIFLSLREMKRRSHRGPASKAPYRGYAEIARSLNVDKQVARRLGLKLRTCPLKLGLSSVQSIHKLPERFAGKVSV